MGKVAVVRAEENIETAVRRSIELAGSLQIKPDMRVVVKPNICNAKNPYGMVITDFAIIEATVKMVREKGCEPLIVESDNIAGHSGKAYQRFRADGEAGGVEGTLSQPKQRRGSRPRGCRHRDHDP